MEVHPIAENVGHTVSMHGNEAMEGLRVVRHPLAEHQVSSPMQMASSDAYNQNNEEDDEFAALMNSDKRKVPSPSENATHFNVDHGAAFTTEPPIPNTPQFVPPPDTYGQPTPPETNATSGTTGSFRTLDEEKMHYLHRIQRMQSRIPGRRMSMSNPLDEIKYEYDRMRRQVELGQSVKIQRRMLMAAVTGIEFLNKSFNPLGLHLDGWSEQVMDSLEDYDPTFEQLHERYSGVAQISPEWNLMIMLLGSGFMYHLSNTLFRSVLPNVNDIAKQNPDLMQNIANAMSSAMGQQGMARAGQSGPQMGANLAMQAAMSRPGGLAAPQMNDDDQTFTDDNGSEIEGASESGWNESVRSVSSPAHPSRRSTAPRGFADAASLLPSRHAAILPQPRMTGPVMSENDEISDMSSEISAFSSSAPDRRSTARGGPGGRKRKARDDRRAVEITL